VISGIKWNKIDFLKLFLFIFLFSIFSFITPRRSIRVGVLFEDLLKIFKKSEIVLVPNITPRRYFRGKTVVGSRSHLAESSSHLVESSSHLAEYNSHETEI
jgi:hypothetical protein